MLNKLKKKLSELKKQVSLKRVLVAVGAALILSGLSSTITAGKKAIEQPYNLILLGSYGPMLVPIEQLQVKRVSHKADGAICFTVLGEEKEGCIKASQYFLKPMNVE